MVPSTKIISIINDKVVGPYICLTTWNIEGNTLESMTSIKRVKGDFIDQVIDILEEKFPQIPSDKIKDLGDIK